MISGKLHIDLDEGDNTLYMFDPNGEALIIAEGRDYAPKTLLEIVKCVNAHDEILRTIDELAAIVERLDETGNYQEDLFNVGKLLKNLEQSK